MGGVKLDKPLTRQEEQNMRQVANNIKTLGDWILMIQAHGEMINSIGGFSPTTSVEGQGSLVIEAGQTFSQSEINAARYMEALGNEVVLRAPSGTRAAGNTSDLLVNGINYDVYTPETGNVNRIVGAIRSKNSQTTGIVLDLSQTKVTRPQLDNLLQRVQGAGGNNIKTIIIMPK